MKYFIHSSLIVLLIIMLGAFEPIFAQNSADIKRGKEEYEKTHPNERTYFIDDVIALLDPADSIMPNAKAVTHERWDEIGGAMFGILNSFNRAGSKDKFTTKYFKDDGKLKRLLTENLLTDASSFQKFMEEHKENGFYKVTLWKAGYLMFYMLEGRDKKKGINLVVVPVKPKLFEKL